MSVNECCRTCKHCGFSQAKSEGWCRLRKLRVHSDIAVFAFCHHWTKQSPALPQLNTRHLSKPVDLQLEFNRALVGTDSSFN